MRTLNKLLLLTLAVCLGLAPAAQADKDKGKKDRGDAVAARSASGPQPGSCILGTAQRDLDINNVQARVFNTGSLFFGSTSSAIYLVPKESGHSAIFASGIWIGGMVNDELHVAGSTYENFEFWPGPLGDDGRPVNPADCSAYDRIWKVSRQDIENYDGTGQASADLAEWPAELGAPVLAAPNNGVDDDGDGDVDEGTDGIDNDGDGRIDERDEQERRVDGGYDLAAGDRPDLIGDQAVWWIMNDVGNTHDNSLTPPIGVEVRVQAFAFNRADALGNTTFYQYTIVYKGDSPLEDTYLSVFSDPDLGDAADDLVGSDTSLSLGYVYNADNDDATYGIPPAVGYDFFQGPIVDGDTLGLTGFSWFENLATGPTRDPDNGVEMYNYMQGLWRDASQMVTGGNGYPPQAPPGGEATRFAFPGDPVTDQFWSMKNTDGNGSDIVGGDRRLMVTTGPFTMNPGDEQVIVFGIAYGLGSDNLSSIDALRAADALAQNAYNADFELPPPPPSPPACDPASANPELQPGSGRCLEASEVNGEAALVWGYPSTSQNYLGGFDVTDPFLAGVGADDETYTFEGFNVYRYTNSGFSDEGRVLVATYDRINEYTKVIDVQLDAATNEFVPYVAANGTNSGLQYYHPLGNLTNYTDYYFGVSAYAVNEESTPKVLEGRPTTITVRPADITLTGGGSATQSEIGQGIATVKVVSGGGIANLQVQVVDPTEVVDATYAVEFYETTLDGETVLTFNVLRNGEVVFNGAEATERSGVAQDGQIPVIIDGLQFFTAIPPEPGQVPAADADGMPDFAGDGAGIVEVAYPGEDSVCPDEGDPGCELYGGNTVWLDPNVNGDYVVTAASNTLATAGLGRFVGAAVPDEYEMRFTEECATPGACLGFYGLGDHEIISVPFELWNVGAVDNPDDDVRMIPIPLNDGGVILTDWEDQFPATQAVPVRGTEMTLPMAQRIYWMMPDRPNGYELFEQDARNLFGGPGGVYDNAADNDDQTDINPATGEPCGEQGAYTDYCYAGAGSFVYPIGRMMIADLAGDGTTPPVGTVIRLYTVPDADFGAGDRFEFSTTDLAFITGDPEIARENLDKIGVVPNPYRGRSAYETGNLDRRVRFINLPEQATVRIYTVAGTLIKTLTKDGPSRSLDWDLTTENNLPVASGMYLIHIEARAADGTELGERVLKFGVINRQFEVDVF